MVGLEGVQAGIKSVEVPSTPEEMIPESEEWKYYKPSSKPALVMKSYIRDAVDDGVELSQRRFGVDLSEMGERLIKLYKETDWEQFDKADFQSNERLKGDYRELRYLLMRTSSRPIEKDYPGYWTEDEFGAAVDRVEELMAQFPKLQTSE